MPISSTMSAAKSELIINVEGRFDFSAHQDFRSAYEDLDGLPKHFSVDFAKSIRTILVEKSTESWNFYYAFLKDLLRIIHH